MLLWPHPLHSVEGDPWNARVGSSKVRPGASIKTIVSWLAIAHPPLWLIGCVRVERVGGRSRVGPAGVPTRIRHSVVMGGPLSWSAPLPREGEVRLPCSE